MFKIHSRVHYLLVCLLLLTSLSTFAQSSEKPLKLNLHTALEKARTNYPSIKQKLEQKKLAEAKAQTTLKQYLPDVGFQAQALLGTSNQIHGMVQNYDGLVLGLTGATRQYSFDAKPTWSSVTAMTIDWQAVTFGQKAIDKQLNNVEIDHADKLYEQEVFEHQIKVADTYLLALNAYKYAQLQQRNVRRTEDIVSVTKANANSGLKAGIDSSIAVAESTRALLLWMDSKVQAEKYLVKLSELIGDATSEIEIDTMQFFSHIPKTYQFDISNPESHPELISMQVRKKVLQYQLDKIRNSARPELHVLGTFWGRGSGISQIPNEHNRFEITSSLSGLKLRAFNYGVGATLVWHPSRLFQSTSKAKEQLHRIEALNHAYETSLQQVNADIKKADLQFNLALQSVQQTPIQLNAARHAYRQSRSRYENGLENIMLLTQVVDLYNKAETDYNLSISNLWRSLLLKAASKGDFSVFMDQIPN